MKFNTALISLWLVSLLAEQVSGGPATGALCVLACNIAYGVCVAGITYSTGSVGFLLALEQCAIAQNGCFALCTLGSLTPTP